MADRTARIRPRRGHIWDARICYPLSRDTSTIGVRQTPRGRAENIRVFPTQTSVLHQDAHAPETPELLRYPNARMRLKRPN